MRLLALDDTKAEDVIAIAVGRKTKSPQEKISLNEDEKKTYAEEMSVYKEGKSETLTTLK